MAPLDDGWFLDAASGAAPRAMSVLVDAHTRLNPLAAARRELADAALAALFEDAEGTDLTSGAFDRAMAALHDEVGSNAAEHLTDPLERLLRNPTAGDALTWRRRVGGIDMIRLAALEEPGVEARLLRLQAGRTVPEHDHEDDEITLVLAGGLHDGRAAYHRGDVCIAGAGVRHTPRVFDEADCICFTVAFGGRRFTSPVTAAFDRLLGGLF